MRKDEYHKKVNAVYYLRKTSSSATPTISLYYAHDYSSSMDLSYSLNVGNYGSITISGDVYRINEMADNFDIPGLKG